MATCVSINCPFIDYCKDYSLTKDRSGGCKTQDNIMALAKRLEKKQKATARSAKKKENKQ